MFINLKEEGLALGLSEAEAVQLTNKGQLLALKAGKPFSESIQIENYWQGQRILDVPSTTISSALSIQNHGNYIAISAGIPSNIALLLNSEMQVNVFAMTSDVTFSRTYGDITAVQYLIAKGVDKTIAQQMTLLCQAVIYSKLPTEEILSDVLQFTDISHCKGYIQSGGSAAAALALSPTQEEFLSNLQMVAYKCIGTAPDYVCVEGVIF